MSPFPACCHLPFSTTDCCNVLIQKKLVVLQYFPLRLGPCSCLFTAVWDSSGRKNWGRILGRNWDKSLKSFPPCYSQSPIFNPPPPPQHWAKVVWKLVFTLNCKHCIASILRTLKIMPGNLNEIYVHELGFRSGYPPHALLKISFYHAVCLTFQDFFAHSFCRTLKDPSLSLKKW